MNDADFETGVLEKDVLDRERQHRRQIVARSIAQFDEPQRQLVVRSSNCRYVTWRPVSNSMIAVWSGRSLAHFATTACSKWRSAKSRS